jgi:hypothetical protein
MMKTADAALRYAPLGHADKFGNRNRDARDLRATPPSFCRPPALGPGRLTRSATGLLYGPDQAPESEVSERHEAVFSDVIQVPRRKP